MDVHSKDDIELYKAKIEQLTESNNETNAELFYARLELEDCENANKSLQTMNANLIEQKTELQKQVSEFTEVFGNADNFARVMSDLRMSNGNRISTSMELCEWVRQQTQQAIQDALQGMVNLVRGNEDFGRGIFGWKTSDILTLIKIYAKEKCGVEVD